jgi:hypothetical protein
MRTLLSLLVCFSVFQARAEAPADPQKDALIASVLETFWDNARDPKGNPILTSPDLDRRTAPIPRSVAYRAIDAGKVAGEGSSCHLRTKELYRAIVTDARELGMTETQVAFVSALYGARWLKVHTDRLPTCTESERNRAANRIFRTKREGLGSPEA